MYAYKEDHAFSKIDVYCEQVVRGSVAGVIEENGVPILAVLENDKLTKDEVYVIPIAQLEHSANTKTLTYQYDCSFFKNISSCQRADLSDSPERIIAIAEDQFGPRDKWKDGFDFVPVNNKDGESTSLGSYQVTDVEPDDNIGMGEVMDYDKMKGID